MSNDKINELYNKPERLRELIASCREQVKEFSTSNDALEAKAWQILATSSATLGIAFTILSAVVGSQPPRVFFLGIGASLLIYLVLFICVFIVISPRKYHLVPGADIDSKGKSKPFRYQEMLEIYVTTDELQYLFDLLSDYLGNADYPDAKGALQLVQEANRLKARWVKYSVVALAFMVASLVITGLLTIHSI
jgi:hypothetical protein